MIKNEMDERGEQEVLMNRKKPAAKTDFDLYKFRFCFHQHSFNNAGTRVGDFHQKISFRLPFGCSPEII